MENPDKSRKPFFRFAGGSVKGQFFAKLNPLGKMLKFDFESLDLPSWLWFTDDYKIGGPAFGLGILFCL